MSYDSTTDTVAHTERVRALLGDVIVGLRRRGRQHDRSKLSSPEKEGFDQFTPKLRELEYGSAEYKAALVEMQPFLDHHYAHNSHHPEFHESGWLDMSLLDIIEMLADWKAAGERGSGGGDLGRSIRLNRERFGYTVQFEDMLLVTAAELHWL